LKNKKSKKIKSKLKHEKLHLGGNFLFANFGLPDGQQHNSMVGE
jgi:hypothetical protein